MLIVNSLAAPLCQKGWKRMEKIRVMLVEDHVLMREGTRELLEREEDMCVVAQAGDGQEAVRLAAKHHPDVILMDIALPGVNGLEATKQIKAADPESTILVLSAYDDDEYVLAFIEAGAAGYLLKSVSSHELVQAVRAIHGGESVLHPTITRKVIGYLSKPHEPKQQEPAPTHLTERELEVLQLAAGGQTNREIGKQLSISARTVQVHLSNVFGKLGVGSRTEAVLYAVRQGWLSLQDVC
jgi:DNA-binding NarL/FixJ family response regulator